MARGKHPITRFFLMVIERRMLIREMVIRDLAMRYVGSLIGFYWTILNPLIMIFILWLVFSVGFRVAPISDAPFVVWLTAGMAIWTAFSQVVQESTPVVAKNPHLVKKIVFPVGILPVVKLAGACVTHLVFVVLLIGLVAWYELPASFYWFQVVYYFVAMSVFSLGVGWLLASIHVFVRDTAQIVGMALQFGFWATPIFWDLSIMPDHLRWIFQMNPMFYIVQGYRESFIEFVPFWSHPMLTLYFWSVSAVVVVVGAVVFMRLRPHFADAL